MKHTIKRGCALILALVMVLALLPAAALAAEELVPIDEAHFPDAVFRGYVASDIDANADGRLSVQERDACSQIFLSDKAVCSLKGLELFPNLTYLDCSGNQLTELDLSSNPLLDSLICYNNLLEQLDVSKNTSLSLLDCESNRLTVLDVSKNSMLTHLYCDSNRMASLDVRGNPEISYVSCSANFYGVASFVDGTVDLSALPGFDPSRVSELPGGSITGNILTIEEGARSVSYSYDVGMGFTEYFSLEHDHVYEQQEIAPTCTQWGMTVYTCACGETYSEASNKQLGHSWEKTGTYTYTCSRCQEELNHSSKTHGLLASEEEWAVLLITNKERFAQGLEALTMNELLQYAGDIRAREIMDLFEHVRPDGTQCYTALTEVGVNSHRTAGENIAAGYWDAAAVMTGWMNSTGHRANILNGNFMHIGVGYYFNSASDYVKHWVQMFHTDFGCSYTDMTLLLPENMEYEPGTELDYMDITIKLTCAACGDCYMPLMSEICSGYDPAVAGVQTVTVSCFGLTERFQVGTVCDHSYTDTVTAPTCTEQGFTTHICSLCGNSYADAYVEPLGHDWLLTERKEPTGTAAGYEKYSCSRCDGTREALLPAIGEEESSFADVPEGAYYADAVRWAVDMGITAGKSATVFGSKDNCTREQVVTFLWRANGSPEPERTESLFTDVGRDAYYGTAVRWAVETGVTAGTTATTFGTGVEVTRAQFVMFLWKAMGSPVPAGSNPFADVPAGSYYEQAVIWAAEQGITAGVSPTEFGSSAPCTRAQVVTFLYKAYANQ